MEGTIISVLGGVQRGLFYSSNRRDSAPERKFAFSNRSLRGADQVRLALGPVQ